MARRSSRMMRAFDGSPRTPHDTVTTRPCSTATTLRVSALGSREAGPGPGDDGLDLGCGVQVAMCSPVADHFKCTQIPEGELLKTHTLDSERPPARAPRGDQDISTSTCHWRALGSRPADTSGAWPRFRLSHSESPSMWARPAPPRRPGLSLAHCTSHARPIQPAWPAHATHARSCILVSFWLQLAACAVRERQVVRPVSRRRAARPTGPPIARNCGARRHLPSCASGHQRPPGFAGCS